MEFQGFRKTSKSCHFRGQFFRLLIDLPPLTQESSPTLAYVAEAETLIEFEVDALEARKSRRLRKRGEILNREPKVNKPYFEMEAELSEDEYAGLAGLDEDEDAVDDALAIEDLGIARDDLAMVNMEDIQDYHRYVHYVIHS